MFYLKAVRCSLVIFVSIFLFSCSGINNPVPDNNNFIPLHVGNSWSYHLTDYDSSGTVIYTYDQTTKIDRDTVISDKKWYTYNGYPAGIWFSNKADGYWAFIITNTGSLKNDTSLILYKYPANTGDVYGNIYFPTEVVSTNEEVTVPAGTFKAIHFSISYQKLNSYMLDSYEVYVVPRVGLIKQMQVGKKSDGSKYIVYKDELVSYSITKTL